MWQPSPRAGKDQYSPEAVSQEGKGNFCLLPFEGFKPLRDGMVPTYTGEGNLLSPPIKILNHLKIPSQTHPEIVSEQPMTQSS